MPHLLEADDAAPAFRLSTSAGGVATLEAYAGRQLVIFFYPKDDTQGCTREAQAFSDLATKFARAKTDLLGISKDPVASHQKFVAKYGLKLVLGADETGATCEAYGVWGEKKLYGRAFMGIIRSTFLIGVDGRIRKVWRKVRVEGHAEAVYEACSSGTS